MQDSSDRSHDQLWDRYYDQLWHPDSWAINADNLRHAAEMLFRLHSASRAEDGEPIHELDTELDGPATLLLGYAMENAIKGLLIKEKRMASVGAKTKPHGWNAHSLVELINQTSVTLDKGDELVLGNLTAFIVWAGKYPVSKTPEANAKGFILPEQFDGTNSSPCENMPPRALNPESRRKTDRLLNLLVERIREGGPKLSPL